MKFGQMIYVLTFIFVLNNELKSLNADYNSKYKKETNIICLFHFSKSNFIYMRMILKSILEK